MASKPSAVTITALSGDDDFMRRRAVAAAIMHQKKQGWVIEKADASKPGAIVNASARNDFMEGSDKPILVVVENPEKADVEFLREYMLNGDPTVVLLLVFEGNPPGNTKFGKLCGELGKMHRSFEKPPDWKAAELAAEFCVAEAASRGRILTAALAASLVERSGSDLGTLYFEMLKISMLAEIEGVAEITPVHVRGGMAPFASSVPAVRDGLQARSHPRLAGALQRLHKNANKDPTMHVIGVLSPAVQGWLAVADLQARGVSLDEIAGRTKMNAWFLKNKVIPNLRGWTAQSLTRLLQSLAEVERAKLNGAVDAWSLLTVRLLESCG
jgi:DNA polymerase III delta subunit